MPFYGPTSSDGGGRVSGSGTANSIAKWTGATALGNSRITDDGDEIVANSGAGAFEAGDTEFVGNGCEIEVNDTDKRVYLQANGNGNFIQTVTLEGGDTSGTITLVAQGPGGTQQIQLDASSGQIRVITPALLPNSTGATDLGSAATRFKQLFLDETLTPGGTNGAQTINKAAGSVNFAASATSLVVTCDKCTTSSIVIATVMTNDTTMKAAQAVPANGSFTLFPSAAPTAATRVGFWVLNQ